MTLLVTFAHFKCSPWIICVVYVLRTGLMNSTTPLTKSILMDNVPTQERGRWSALESVNMFSWSGSAALGGILVSFDGLLFNFSVTATMQFMATMPVIALMVAAPVDRLGSDRNDGDEGPEAASLLEDSPRATPALGQDDDTRRPSVS